MLSRAVITVCLMVVSLAQAPSSRSAQVEAELGQALLGQWTGVLEYRDYSEPATSTKRVQLPTWLTVTNLAGVLTEHFVYDDGPGKTVESKQMVTFNVSSKTYTEQEYSKPAQTSQVTGFETLKGGRGELVLMGQGLDNDKPAETRTTLTIRRNLLTWLDEVRLAKSQEAFTFRHRYTFTRAVSPPTSQQGLR